MELDENVRKAVSELGLDAGIEHVTETDMGFDGKAVSYGKALSAEEAKKILC